MVELYTALGLAKIYTLNGVQCPSVSVDGHCYPLSAEEMVVWSALTWRILNIERLETLCRDMSHGKSYSLHIDCLEVLQGLINTGLVARGQGQTEAEALERLLDGLNIIPIEQSMTRRLTAFFLAVKRGQIPITAAFRIFERPKLTAQEQNILVLCKNRVPLAINSITAREIILGRDLKDTITAIANLLLHKQILLVESKSK